MANNSQETRSCGTRDRGSGHAFEAALFLDGICGRPRLRPEYQLPSKVACSSLTPYAETGMRISGIMFPFRSFVQSVERLGERPFRFDAVRRDVEIAHTVLPRG